MATLEGVKSPSDRLLIVIVALAITVTACGPGVVTASPSPRPSTESPAPATSSALPAGQTDTEWGRIWDELPAGFPIYPGSTLAGDASPEAVSGRYAIVGGDPAEIASWMQTALEAATFSTEALSGPLEDGRYVLDSVGQGDCRIETTVVPLSRLTFLSVRYGAVCPLT